MRLWVLDEMRHGLHGFTQRVWGLPGHRPVAATKQVYQRGYVYGAVGLESLSTWHSEHDGVCLTVPLELKSLSHRLQNRCVPDDCVVFIYNQSFPNR